MRAAARYDVQATNATGRGLTGKDLLLAGCVALLAALGRVAFVLAQELPTFDPWRHLALIRNVRAGLGFTLFESQPYVWYSPIWYLLCGSLPDALAPDRVAAVFSTLAAPLAYLLLRDPARAESRTPALVAGSLVALSGPLVAFTCHHGQEALALFLALSGLVLARWSRGVPAILLAGVAFGAGVSMRMNLAFLALLFLAELRTRRRLVPLAVGIALPLALAWWRNHQVIASHAFVFTWDGLATRSSDYGPLSTLVVQMHPAVQEGLRRLHALIVPWPEWIRDANGLRLDTIALVTGGVACVLACRRVAWIGAAALTLGYFLLLDSSRSSHFFRLYLPLFPLFALAAGELAGKLGRSTRSGARAAAIALPIALALAGARLFVPQPMAPLAMVTPPPGLLTEERYLVNSAFYHPESLIWRFPSKRFVGLPLDPEQLADFRREYPDYRHVLWHDFVSVQDELARHLVGPAGFAARPPVANAHGRRYAVLQAPEAGGG